jgi:hypothetical protein
MQRKRADGYIEDIETPEEIIQKLQVQIAGLKDALLAISDGCVDPQQVAKAALEQ